MADLKKLQALSLRRALKAVESKIAELEDSGNVKGLAALTDKLGMLEFSSKFAFERCRNLKK